MISVGNPNDDPGSFWRLWSPPIEDGKLSFRYMIYVCCKRNGKQCSGQITINP